MPLMTYPEQDGRERMKFENGAYICGAKSASAGS